MRMDSTTSQRGSAHGVGRRHRSSSWRRVSWARVARVMGRESGGVGGKFRECMARHKGPGHIAGEEERC